MRRGAQGLMAIVEGEMNLDPFSAKLFVFCNRGRTIIKAVAREGNVFILLVKHIEKARFIWPSDLTMDCVQLTAQQVSWLLDGYDLTHFKGHSRLPHHTLL